MKVELRDHIAQARHPVTNKPLVDDNGKPVPLFPDQRSIWLDGAMVGYVCGPPDFNIGFIVPESKISQFVRNLIAEQVRIELGKSGDVFSVAEPPIVEVEEDDADDSD